MKYLYQTLYTIAFSLMVPVFLFRLFYKSKAHRQRWWERLGVVKAIKPMRPVIWIHAVSVGEVKVTEQLVNTIGQSYPEQFDFVITTTTPTGAEQVVRQYSQSVHHVYHPYDVPICVNAFLNRIKPALLLVMETELWPNLYKCCHHKSIPVVLVNGRMSERSFTRYQACRLQLLGVFEHLALICSQTEEERQRYIELGMDGNNVHVTGSMKFDARIPDATRSPYVSQLLQELDHRPVWMAASTHPGEDDMVIHTHKRLLRDYPSLLLILAPRHPERCKELMGLIAECGLRGLRRTDELIPQNIDNIFMLDSIGELFCLYEAAELAFIGGSLVDRGGQNPLEAIMQNTTLISGPNTRNFKYVYEQLAINEAVTIVDSEASLEEAVRLLLTRPDLSKSSKDKASSFLNSNQGSTQRTLEHLKPWLQKMKLS